MHPSAKVRGWATALSILSYLGFAGLIVLLAVAILFFDLPFEIRDAAGIASDASLSPFHRMSVAAIGAIPMIAMLYVLWHMGQLFGRYAKGETLTAACANHIQNIGTGLLVAAILGIFTRTAQITLASLGNPPGERVVVIGLQGADYGQLLAGGLMLMIGWVMADAVRIADENASFV